MQPRTTSANTRQWLRAHDGMRATAYIESYVPTLNLCDKAAASRDFLEALREVSVPLPAKEAPPYVGPELTQEFNAWDVLSDQAWLNLEEELA